MLREFNEELKRYLADRENPNCLVFIFGEAYERSQPFLARVFGQALLSQKGVGQLSLNSPTEKTML